MKAIVKADFGPGFKIQEVPTPRPGPGEVLVRVMAVGICGSDVPVFDGSDPPPYVPLIPGHEFSGVISEIGSGVGTWKQGERVAVSLVVPCGECFFCRHGEPTLCEKLVLIGCNGRDGAFAEYVVVPNKCLHRLPEELSFEEGASVDPIASAYRPVKKARIGSEDTVAVIGPGPIGLYAAQLVALEGARPVVVGRSRERLELAKELGIVDVVNINTTDAVQEIRSLTSGKGCDAVIECTGNPQAVVDALRYVRPQGRVVLVGIFHDQAPLDIRSVVFREVRIEGSICYTWDEFEHCLQLVSAGKVRVAPLITHVLPLSSMEEALDLIHARRAVKVILKP